MCFIFDFVFMKFAKIPPLLSKKNMRNRVLHKFSTCHLCVTTEGYQSKRQIPKMHFHIENREEFLFLPESIKYMENAQTADAKIA